MCLTLLLAVHSYVKRIRFLRLLVFKSFVPTFSVSQAKAIRGLIGYPDNIMNDEYLTLEYKDVWILFFHWTGVIQYIVGSKLYQFYENISYELFVVHMTQCW